ncbi:S8 family serine peptidase [Paenibacillus algorifonticola]|uniref:S8 family serine peptidase n=1 Tax=Paenibacillus algorifonticola TaxID=684063 RepID=UPI0022B0CB64|nr:S8 family serine peptidase [Paenibacillus algorifonticola]
MFDVQARGREVTTTGYGDLQSGNDENQQYTDQFSGTSSASPIFVGVLGCLQGILRAKNKELLTYSRVRELLRNTGSPQQDAPSFPRTQRIGNRPDMHQLIENIL